jgi:ribosomal protein S18 acetylase RimI-like enzyme
MNVVDPISIRPATLADAPSLVPLLAALGYPVDESIVERNLREFNQFPEMYCVFVATVGIAVAGVAVGQMMPMLQHERPLGRISTLTVDAQQRGLGVGRRLLQAVERWFASRGVTRLEITSAEHREDGHAFLRRLGFREKRLRLVKDRN